LGSLFFRNTFSEKGTEALLDLFQPLLELPRVQFLGFGGFFEAVPGVDLALVDHGDPEE
jgi:hypothetical protein